MFDIKLAKIAPDNVRNYRDPETAIYGMACPLPPEAASRAIGRNNNRAIRPLQPFGIKRGDSHIFQ